MHCVTVLVHLLYLFTYNVDHQQDLYWHNICVPFIFVFLFCIRMLFAPINILQVSREWTKTHVERDLFFVRFQLKNDFDMFQ
jgi:hypothetical protein